MTYVRGALLAGGFRSWTDLKSMSADDQRNTLIVELAGRTSQNGGFYQAMDSWALAGAGWLTVLMRIGQIRDDETLRGMTLDGIRNTFIVELDGFTGLGNSLQAYDNVRLAEIGLTGHEGVRGALLMARTLSWRQLNAMSADDQRNALINLLASHSRHSVGHFQGQPDADLAAAAGLMLVLRDGGVRDVTALAAMTTDDQRNTVIVELDSYLHVGRRLQGFDNADLVRIAMGQNLLLAAGEHLDVEPPVDLQALIPVPDIEVRYAGLQCFAETDVDQGSNSDEPYLVITTGTLAGQTTLRTTIYDDVDAGESRVDDILLYRGPADALSLVVQVMEHDNGDADEVRDDVNAAADKAAAGVAGALVGVPKVGPVLSALFIAAWEKWGPEIKDALVWLVADNHLGSAELTFTRRQLTEQARGSLQEFRGVSFTTETPLVEGAGSSYKAAFRVRLAG